MEEWQTANFQPSDWGEAMPWDSMPQKKVMLGVSNARRERYQASASEGEKADSVNCLEKFKDIQWIQNMLTM